MQPYAIVKNRSFSLIVKAFIGTAITTLLVIGNSYYKPYRRRIKSYEMESFADNYYMVHENQKAVHDVKLEK